MPVVLFLDNFTGAAGPLSGHMSDSGATYPGADSLLLLDGAGKLYYNNMFNWKTLNQSATIAQGITTLEVVIRTGTIPTSTTYGYLQQIWFGLWDVSFLVELTHQIGGTNQLRAWTQYSNPANPYPGGFALSLNAYATPANNTTYKIRWVIDPLVNTKVYINDVLAATSTGPQKPLATVGSSRFESYLEDNSDSGAPTAHFFYVDSLAVNAPPARPADGTLIAQDTLSGSGTLSGRTPTIGGPWSLADGSGAALTAAAVTADGMHVTAPSYGLYKIGTTAPITKYWWARATLVLTNIAHGANQAQGGLTMTDDASGTEVAIFLLTGVNPTPNTISLVTNISSAGGNVSNTNITLGLSYGVPYTLMVRTDDGVHYAFSIDGVVTHTLTAPGAVALPQRATLFSSDSFANTTANRLKFSQFEVANLGPYETKPFWTSFDESHEVLDG